MRIFIFAKNDKIKAIDVASTNEFRNLEKDGWKHTATLDACRWLEYWLTSSSEDREAEVDELKGLRPTTDKQ